MISVKNQPDAKAVKSLAENFPIRFFLSPSACLPLKRISFEFQIRSAKRIKQIVINENEKKLRAVKNLQTGKIRSPFLWNRRHSCDCSRLQNKK